jgi:SiaC family regulatory phosphoprotein
MKPLIIKGTDKTPHINFDASSGHLLFKGRSYAQETYDFYKPINEWINLYAQNLKDITVFDINVDYVNSVSVKYLTNMIKKLIEFNINGKTITVNWYHPADDEDDAYELGRSIEREAKIKFNYIVL